MEIINKKKLNNIFPQRIFEKKEFLFHQVDLVRDEYIINSGEIMLERNNVKIEKLGIDEAFRVFNLFFENKN